MPFLDDIVELLIQWKPRLDLPECSLDDHFVMARYIINLEPIFFESLNTGTADDKACRKERLAHILPVVQLLKEKVGHIMGLHRLHETEKRIKEHLGLIGSPSPVQDPFRRCGGCGDFRIHHLPDGKCILERCGCMAFTA